MIEWLPTRPSLAIHLRKPALERFLVRFPERLETRLALADQHLYLGETEEAGNVLDDVQDHVRSEPEWLASYGRVARALGREQAAEDCLQKAYDGGARAGGVELARLFNTQGRHAEAIALSEAILAEAPDVYAAAADLCKGLIATDQLDTLWQWTQRRLHANQWSAVLPSAQAYASTNARRVEATQALVAADRTLAYERNLAGASLAAELSNKLVTHPLRASVPTIYAGTGEGERVDRLLELDIDEVTHLFGLVREAVARYIASDSERTKSNAYIAGFPKAASVDAWANICVGNGHESWHCHPGGWLSGVYYVDVPDVAKDQAEAGQIEFGPLMLSESNDLSAWPKIRLKPETDMLLLFPSYVGHRTYPTLMRHARVSIAFDVVPQPYDAPQPDCDG